MIIDPVLVNWSEDFRRAGVCSWSTQSPKPRNNHIGLHSPHQSDQHARLSNLGFLQVTAAGNAQGWSGNVHLETS